MAINRVVSILMLRDKLSRSEAESLVKDVRNQMAECNYGSYRVRRYIYVRVRT